MRINAQMEHEDRRRSSGWAEQSWWWIKCLGGWEYFGYKPYTLKRPDSADEHERSYDTII